MGTTYRVLVNHAEVTPDLAQARIDAELAAVNLALSTWTATSELSGFNRDCTRPLHASPMLQTVVAASRQVFEASGGAFDPSVVPLLALWGFGPGGRAVDAVPAEGEIRAAMQRVGFLHIQFGADGALACEIPGMALDFSAIAKGYAVDRVHDALRAAGARNLLVEIGGEVRVSGRRPDGSPFSVGIERPAVAAGEADATQAAPRRAQHLLGARELTHGAVATSGNYRNFLVFSGRRYTHIIDPRTGWPVPEGLASVSVFAQNAMMADAWATALMVLGPIDGPAVAKTEGLTALFVLESGEEIAVPHSPAFYEAFSSVER